MLLLTRDGLIDKKIFTRTTAVMANSSKLGSN